MDVMTHAGLRQLMDAGTDPCVSIFMPTHIAGREVRQDPVRLRDMLKKVEEDLITRGYAKNRIPDLLQPARDLLDNESFWQHSDHGLAIYLSESHSQILRVPIEVDDLAVVNSHFYLRPLLPLLTDKHFYIVAISQGDVRLLECTPHSCRKVELPEDVALSRDEAIQGEDEHQTHTMRHGGDASNAFSGGGAWHGQAEATRKDQEDLMFYLRQADEGIRRVMADPDARVVLAGVDSVTPAYRKASAIKNIVEGAIHGNPEHVADEKLHQQALEVLEPVWHKELNGLQERYGNALAQSLAANDIVEVLSAAEQGRVDTLFVAIGAMRWGQPEGENGEIAVHDEQAAGDEDLIDAAAMATLRTSGRVVAVPPEHVPNNGDIAAIYRY
jgi:hypothetical protein